MQDPASEPHVTLFLKASTNLIDWNVVTEPVNDTTGKPSDRQWWQADSQHQSPLFFRLEAQLRE